MYVDVVEFIYLMLLTNFRQLCQGLYALVWKKLQLSKQHKVFANAQHDKNVQNCNNITCFGILNLNGKWID